MPAPSIPSETITLNRYSRTAVIPLLVAFMSIISGCGESGAPASSETAAPAAAAEPELPNVEIDLDEFVILMDARVPAGPVTLKLANRGFEEHNLVFVVAESDSTVWASDGRLSPGERRSVTVDLSAGEYRAVCDYSDHEDRGMIVDFLVEENSE